MTGVLEPRWAEAGRALAAGVLTLLTLVVAVPGAAAQGTEKQAPRRPVAGLQAFETRVDEYVALRDRVEATLPPFNETRDPVKLTARQRALAKALIEARAGVSQGDVFVPASRQILTRIIRDDFARRSRADKRALEEDLPSSATVTANVEYPDGIVLVTVPPALLQKLPGLPDELEFRLVARDLILLDNKAGLVVDVLPGVVPR